MQDKNILNTWKEIARYVGRSARTIQRWERDLGFPIHRPSGREGGAVLAIPSEIDQWVQKAPIRDLQNSATPIASPPREVTKEHAGVPDGVIRGEGSRAEPYQPSSDAHQEYLRGQFFWNKRTHADIRRAIECYDEAIKIDPSHALAFVGLAQAYVILGIYGNIPLQEGYRQAKVAALMALRIDDSLGPAHAALAAAKAGEWDLPGALAGFARAIDLDRNDVTARYWYAEHLICAAHVAEALAESRCALQLDPMSLSANMSAGLVLLQARDYDAAIAQLRKTLKIDKHCHVCRRILRDAYLARDMYEAAIAEHKLAAIAAGQDAATARAQAEAFHRAYTRAGSRGYWQQRLKFGLNNARHPSALPYDMADASPYHIAVIYASLGRDEQATSSLQRALQEHDYALYYIKTNAVFDSLRTLPAVLALMRRIGVER